MMASARFDSVTREYASPVSPSRAKSAASARRRSAGAAETDARMRDAAVRVASGATGRVSPGFETARVSFDAALVCLPFGASFETPEGPAASVESFGAFGVFPPTPAVSSVVVSDPARARTNASHASLCFSSASTRRLRSLTAATRVVSRS